MAGLEHAISQTEGIAENQWNAAAQTLARAKTALRTGQRTLAANLLRRDGKIAHALTQTAKHLRHLQGKLRKACRRDRTQ